MSSVEPFDIEYGKSDVKGKNKEKPSKDENTPTMWQRWKSDWKAKKINWSLLVIVPLIVLIEVAMNYNMLTIPPGKPFNFIPIQFRYLSSHFTFVNLIFSLVDHPVHISTYCAQCGIDVGTAFHAISDDENVKKAVGACMEDGILGLVGEAFTVFNGNYMATLLGHILTTYALLMSLDADIMSAEVKSLSNILHGFGYVLLLVDVIVEFIILMEVASHDPNTIDVMQVNMRIHTCIHTYIHTYSYIYVLVHT